MSTQKRVTYIIILMHKSEGNEPPDREKLEKDGLMVPKGPRETGCSCWGGLVWIRHRCPIAGFSKLAVS